MTMMKIIHIVIAVVETSKGQETFLSLSSCFIYHQEEVMVLTHPAHYNVPNEEDRDWRVLGKYHQQIIVKVRFDNWVK